MKHFILFLVYVWLASAYALSLFALNYFLCNSNGNGNGSGNGNIDDDMNNNYYENESENGCTFPVVLVQLVRIMTVLCFGALAFTSSMIMSVLWGMVTGLGTIDRMKREEAESKSNSSVVEHSLYNEPPIPWKDIFGIQHYYSWFLPIDPMFDDHDRIMGYSTIPRLRREKKMDGNGSTTSEKQSNNFPTF